MNCEICNHEMNIFSFAYKQLQECPVCHTKYEMYFPSGMWMIPFFIMILCGGYTLTTGMFNTLTQISFLIIVYFVVDIFMKFVLIYVGKYSMEVKE